jgi:hypothetical protein
MPFGSIDENCNAKQYYQRVCNSLRKSQGEDIQYFTREQLYDQLYTISENDQREIDLIVKAYRKVLREKTQCIEDGCNNPRGSNGKGTRKIRCTTCHKRYHATRAGYTSISQWNNQWHPYKKYRKDYCENNDGRLGHGECTTTIVDPSWQLEVDHIDGNPSNNDPSNLQTLCSCCHRLKTRDKRDWETAGRKTHGIAA